MPIGDTTQTSLLQNAAAALSGKPYKPSRCQMVVVSPAWLRV